MRRLDIAFFGQLQMTFSGLSEGLVERVAARPALLAYIERMNAMFDDYPFNCYTRRVINGEVLPRDKCFGLSHAPLGQQFVTLTSLCTLLTVALPVLFAFLTVSSYMRSSNAEATGKRLNPKTYWGQLLAGQLLRLRSKQ